MHNFASLQKELFVYDISENTIRMSLNINKKGKTKRENYVKKGTNKGGQMKKEKKEEGTK